MRYQKHCPGCFRRKDGVAICPYCGYDEAAPRSPLFLPHGTVIGGQYRIGRLLGRPGGFGITYLGWDVYLQQKVAIKEYLPPEIAARLPQSQGVTVHTQDDRKGFDWGKEQFLREARLVASLNHPNVVRVRGFFNANDTAYLVMDYYEGMTLDGYLQTIKPSIADDVAVALMLLILDGLAYVHAHGVVHRDVKPHNIYLAAVGRPILLDFGAARQAMGSQMHAHLSVVFTEGYAPLEQYQRRGVQGPWTDVYGAAATLFRMISGRLPPVPMDRVSDDTAMTEALLEVPEYLRPVLAKALALKPEDRYQSAGEFKAALTAVQEAQELAKAQPPTEDAASTAAFIASANAQRQAERSATGDSAAVAPGTAPQPQPSGSDGLVVRPTPEGEVTVEMPPPPQQQVSLLRRLMPYAALLVVGIAGWLVLSPKPSSHPETAAATSAAPLPAGTPAELIAPKVTPPKLMDIAGGEISLAEVTDVAPAGVSRKLRLKPFRLGQSEVTVAEFRAFVLAGGTPGTQQPCEGAPPGGDWRNPGFTVADDQPVVCVTQRDALAYAAWLSKNVADGYRLPTEAEWNYAARAGSRTLFWWGNSVDADHAQCADCGGTAPKTPWSVRRLVANPNGLYGMSGNVREWTCSRFEEIESIATTGCAPPDDPGPVAIRGGAWSDPQSELRSDSRRGADPDSRNIWTGFRVAANVPDVAGE